MPSTTLSLIGHALTRRNSALLLFNIGTLVLDAIPNDSFDGGTTFFTQITGAYVHLSVTPAFANCRHPVSQTASSVALSSTCVVCTSKTHQAGALIQCLASSSPFNLSREPSQRVWSETWARLFERASFSSQTMIRRKCICRMILSTLA